MNFAAYHLLNIYIEIPNSRCKTTNNLRTISEKCHISVISSVYLILKNISFNIFNYYKTKTAIALFLSKPEINFYDPERIWEIIS